MIVAAVGLRREARSLAAGGVTFVIGGGDSGGLEAALDAAAAGTDGIVSIGIAGALAPDLRPGDWVVATAVGDRDAAIPTDSGWCARLVAALGAPPRPAVTGLVLGSDAIIGDAAEKSALHARTGALAVDMESHVAARVAGRHGLRFAAARVISDAADRSLPHAARVGMRPNGSADLPAVLRSLTRDPRQLPGLLRTAWDAERAFRALLRGGRGLSGLARDPHPR